MVRALCYLGVIALVIVLALGTPARAQEATPKHANIPTPDGAPIRKAPPPRTPENDANANRNTPVPREEAEPDHIRGQITKVGSSSIDVKTGDGKTVRLGLSDNLTIISLTKAKFTDVDFGVYVGSVAVRMEEYSPIIRDSLSWLHKGYELRIIDEQLRGIALGHKKWDLTPDSVIAHGWVDDLEERVMSIKYGPTEQEETDVQVPRDVPILKMSLGDMSLIRPGANVFVGAQNGGDGKYVAVFILVGKDGIVPPM